MQPKLNECYGDISPTTVLLVSNTLDMTTARPALWALIAIGATIFALLLAERVGGPLIRAVLGTPAGFHEDFTSRPALGQALLAQTVFVGLAFFTLGTAVGQRLKSLRYKYAVWVANPITVGLGFAAYKAIYHSLHLRDYLPEYDSPTIFVLFCIASPLVFALCFYAGASVRRSLGVGT
jgi:hypothetical protein